MTILERASWRKVRESTGFVTFLAVVAALLLGPLSDTIKDSVEYWITHGRLGALQWTGLIWLVAFTLASGGVYILRRNFFEFEVQSINPPETRRHLVLFVSTLNPNDEYIKGVPKWFTLTSSLDADLARLFELKKRDGGKQQGAPNSTTRHLWSWEMALRAVRFHANGKKIALDSLTLVGSDKSVDMLDLLATILQSYFPELRIFFLSRYTSKEQPALHEFKRNAVQVAAENLLANDEQQDIEPFSARTRVGWQFDDIEALLTATRQLRDLLHERGISDKQITIDMTSGLGATSAAAALSSVHRGIQAQYVMSNEKVDEIIRGYQVLSKRAFREVT